MIVHKSATGKLPDLGSYSQYIFYTNKLLAKYPEYKAFRDARLRTKGVNVIFKVVDYVKTPVMDYALFSKVITAFNKKAQAAIIQGERLRIGFGLGYIEASCIERNFNRPKLNMIETMRLRKAGDEKALVYYTDEDYCRISWRKTGNVRNCAAYEFKPTFDFRKAFAAALNASPLLKFKYVFHEYKDTHFTQEDVEKRKAYILKKQERNQLKAAA